MSSLQEHWWSIWRHTTRKKKDTRRKYTDRKKIAGTRPQQWWKIANHLCWQKKKCQWSKSVRKHIRPSVVVFWRKRGHFQCQKILCRWKYSIGCNYIWHKVLEPKILYQPWALLVKRGTDHHPLILPFCCLKSNTDEYPNQHRWKSSFSVPVTLNVMVILLGKMNRHEHRKRFYLLRKDVFGHCCFSSFRWGGEPFVYLGY